MNERKEQSLLFVLSLPLSIPNTCAPRCSACSRLPDMWSISCAAALVAGVLQGSVPDGLAPYVILL
jgi:hypothetical protein